MLRLAIALSQRRTDVCDRRSVAHAWSVAPRLQVQGGGASDAAADQTSSTWSRSSSPGSKLVLLVLILFSIASWAVILYKLWTLNRAQRQSATFLEVFRRSSKFSEVQAVCKNLGRARWSAFFRRGTPSSTRSFGNHRPPPPAQLRHRAPPTLKAWRRSTARCCVRRPSRSTSSNPLTLLATTASITPYIGLFGTVWGIMGAFQGIGADGIDQPWCGRARVLPTRSSRPPPACSPPFRPSTSTTISRAA